LSKKIYKYVGPDVLEKAFTQDGICRFKCSYPQDFNDPYELSLTIDFNQKPEILAFYAETVGSMPQKATTCFSKLPNVIPMWAHYGHNHCGLVIEIDEEKIQERFPEVSFGDVDYQDEPHDYIIEHLYRAFGTKKPRHTYILWQAVMSGAYYTKSACWSYEQERRLVLPSKYIDDNSGLMLFSIPYDCVTAIISGTKATIDNRSIAKQITNACACSGYQMVIGRSSTEPYFIDESGTTYIFNQGSISAAPHSCPVCKEPIATEMKKCGWCSIEDFHRENAAGSNPMRVISNAGLLDNYLAGMREIDKGRSKL
jgi:Protein of unknown function (DUF2971)